MEELELLRLLPGQEVRVDGPDDGQVLLNVDGRSVRLDAVVAAEVYVSV
jgi:hypothetical protein